MNNFGDLDHSADNASPADPDKSGRKTVLLLIGALVFLIISAVIGGLLFASSAGFTPGMIIAKLRSLTLAREKMLQGEEGDRVNVLLLGMGGAGHEGATLTDTIIFSSIRPTDGAIGLISIPRDLQVLIADYGYRKINSVNAYAEARSPGTGAAAVSQIVSGVFSQPVHYYLRVDFQAFEEIIDTVGGIDIDVEQAFYDPFYPDSNFGYDPVAFEKGLQTMSGARALQFVRSRHGTNGEGNDFARARRQQKVLSALKERLLSFDVLLRPNRIKSIVESLQDHIQTNITFWEGMRFARILREVPSEKILSRVLDSGPDGLLVERYYNGAFVLEPRDQSWGEVRELAEGLLDATSPSKTNVILSEAERSEESRAHARPASAGDPSVALLPQDDKIIAPIPAIEIQNGTLINGLAARTAEKLGTLGFNPISLGNAPTREMTDTIAYDLTGGIKRDEFERLKKALGAIEGEGEPAQILYKGTLDFLVILGSDTSL